MKFAIAMLTALLFAGAVRAQAPVPGGTLKLYLRDSPGTASPLEEASRTATVPFMGIFNNLVMFDQNEPVNSESSLVPELATFWSWNVDHTRLSFKLREGVTWHDGKPFTAADVKCTFDLLMGTGTDKLRKNPRKSWFANVERVEAVNPQEAVLQLKRPQPSILSMLAAGYSAVYPCHVSAAKMRVAPIGTGPFKLATFQMNEVIRLEKNSNYWKPGRPYLDAIEMPVIGNRATAMLAFSSGKVDMTFPFDITGPMAREIKRDAAKAVCAFGPMNSTQNLIVNRERPPFDNPNVRRAMALTIDRKAFATIMFEGLGDIGGTMLPQPAGIWGMPPETIATMFGYNPDIAKNRGEGRALMEAAGFGPRNRLSVKVSTRNLPIYRDAAVILIDHLKEIYIDGELDPVDTSLWFTRLARKDYAIGMNTTSNAIDDPDQALYENFACGSERNYSQYCNPELQKSFDLQSAEIDLEKRKRMVWDIDRRLQEDVARPVILHQITGTCWHPAVHGFTPMVNSSANGYRFEDIWIDH